ncbi:unnamed protein product [Rotaria socialis]
MNSCMIISDLNQESYMSIQDHTENHTKNRRLCDLMSDHTAYRPLGPALKGPQAARFYRVFSFTDDVCDLNFIHSWQPQDTIRN